MKAAIDILMVVLLGGLVFMVALSIINKWLPRWACDRFGWHLRPKAIGHDGASFNGQCPRCKRKVLQDSQGNWFAISESQREVE